jgi:hypothetical protein
MDVLDLIIEAADLSSLCYAPLEREDSSSNPFDY